MNLIAHLMAMRPGLRVRTPGGVLYADSGLEVPEGTHGTVRAVTCAGALVDIEWDGIAGLHRTAFDSVDPVHEAAPPIGSKR